MDFGTLPAWGSFAVAGVALLVALAGNRSKALAEKFRGLAGRLDQVEDRVTKIESEMQHLPGTDAIHRLEVALEELKGDVRVLGEKLHPVSAIAGRLQEFLIERAGA